MSSKKDVCSNSSLEVAIALPVSNTYSYGVPEILAGLTTEGKRVLVPFGKRRVTGYVLGPAQNSGSLEIKSILDLLDDEPLFSSEMIPFFRWIAAYYLYPIGQVIKNALPGGLNLYEFTTLAITQQGCEALSGETPLRQRADRGQAT